MILGGRVGKDIKEDGGWGEAKPSTKGKQTPKNLLYESNLKDYNIMVCQNSENLAGGES
jgi:hypothetical protein